MSTDNPREPGTFAERMPSPSGRRLRTGLARRRALTLALRALVEAGIVGAFAYWGFEAGPGTGMKVLLAVGAPALGFGFWGAVDFHLAGRLAEPLRLLQELAISGLAAAALFTAGQHLLGWVLGLVSVVYHALVYLQGGRLLRHP